MTDLEKKVLSYVEKNKEDLYSMLSSLIRFDSQNFITYGREQPCAEYIEKLYLAAGLETERYDADDIKGIKEHPGYLCGRGMNQRPNVSGVLYGEDKKLSCMLAAHIDTMPVGDLSKWTVDPFGGEIKDGKIYGLGSGDNKFGISGSLFAIKALKACGVNLKKTVVLTSYADEEYGGGDGALAACLKYPCDVYVNLDGGNYEMWVSSLGGGGFEIEVSTNGTTDTAAPVVNALFEIKTQLEKMGDRRKKELHNNPLYTNSDMERSAYRLGGFNVGSFGSDLDSGKLTVVFYTTSPKELINKELDEILENIKPTLEKYNLKTSGFKPNTRFFGYYETNDITGAVQVMTEAASETAGRKIKTCGACLSDLSVFLPYGSSESFNFGILRDFSLYGGAHQPDEYVECAQYVEHTKALVLFLMRYCGVLPN